MSKKKYISKIDGFVISIDGPSASGKGSLTEALASEFHSKFLETGRMYRECAARIKFKFPNIISSDEVTEQMIDFAYKVSNEIARNFELYSEENSTFASIFAMNPIIRKVLTKKQRDFALFNKSSGAIIEGRDIGSTVYPEADVKIFLTCKTSERAKRRFNQYKKAGKTKRFDQILLGIIERDIRDLKRQHSPTRIPLDAIILDNSNLSFEETKLKALEIISDVLLNSRNNENI